MILIGKEEIIVGDYNTAKVLNTFLSNIVNNLESLGGGVPKILVEMGITLKRGRGGVDVEMGEGRLPVFYCFAVQLHLLCVWGGGVSFLYYILVFHSDSLQRMLTALYKLAWNTQKSACTNSFKYQGKMVLDIENVLVT